MAKSDVVVKQDGYEFRATGTGFDVFRQKNRNTLVPIGSIVTHQESNGRHCFRLGCDNRAEPRTYRGKVTAAKALGVLEDLLHNKQLESQTALILAAWDNVPSTV